MREKKLIGSEEEWQIPAFENGRKFEQLEVHEICQALFLTCWVAYSLE
jgi:hypothetical protein